MRAFAREEAQEVGAIIAETRIRRVSGTSELAITLRLGTLRRRKRDSSQRSGAGTSSTAGPARPVVAAATASVSSRTWRMFVAQDSARTEPPTSRISSRDEK